MPRPSVMSTASRQECGSRARATVANQDLTVVQVEQTAEYAGEKSRATFDICSSVKACTSSFMCVDVQSCSIFSGILLIFAPQSDSLTDPFRDFLWTPGVLAYLV